MIFFAGRARFEAGGVQLEHAVQTGPLVDRAKFVEPAVPRPEMTDERVTAASQRVPRRRIPAVAEKTGERGRRPAVVRHPIEPKIDADIVEQLQGYRLVFAAHRVIEGLGVNQHGPRAMGVRLNVIEEVCPLGALCRSGSAAAIAGARADPNTPARTM
ncbi:hypothetical protein ABWH91_15970 [Phycisphaerales bacterium ac7]